MLETLLDNIYIHGNCCLYIPQENLESGNVVELIVDENGGIRCITKKVVISNLPSDDNQAPTFSEEIKTSEKGHEELLKYLSGFLISALLGKSYIFYDNSCRSNNGQSGLSVIYITLDNLLSNWSYATIYNFLDSEDKVEYLVKHGEKQNMLIDDYPYDVAKTEINRKFSFLNTKFKDVLRVYNCESIEQLVTMYSERSELRKILFNDDTPFAELAPRRMTRNI